MTLAEPLAERMPRVDSLTGLRWWAAFFVFAYHVRVFAPLPGITGETLGYGYFGVTFFFVLSGFVLTWSASSRVSTSTFYWRRVARIYPAHLVALLLALPVFYSLGAVADGSWVKEAEFAPIALSVVLLQGWSSDPEIFFAGNPASWSLTYEAFFYLLHPAILFLLLRLRQRGAVVFVIATIGVMFAYRAAAVLAPDSIITAVPAPVVHLPEFAIGMGLAWAFRCGWRPAIPGAVGVGLLGAVIAGFVLLERFGAGSTAAWLSGQFLNEVVTVACAVAITALAAEAMRGRRSILESRALVVLGEWSFCFYLVHATLIYAALALFGYQPASWANLGWYAVTLVVSIAAAAALHLLVEKPAERRMRAWKDNRDAVRRAAVSSTVA